MNVGAGNEYICIALEKIGRHLGLREVQTGAQRGRHMEDGNSEAVAALKFLVEGEFWSLGPGVRPHGGDSVAPSKYDGCEPPRLTVPLSDPIASPIPLLDSQQTGIQPQGGWPGATT